MKTSTWCHVIAFVAVVLSAVASFSERFPLFVVWGLIAAFFYGCMFICQAIEGAVRRFEEWHEHEESERIYQ